jgi:hypothetical protein
MLAMKAHSQSSQNKKNFNWLILLWCIALVGYFLPWINRQPYSAALNWNAYDLYDAVRLLPEIETGSISVNLQTLRTPLLGLALLLSFHLVHSTPVVRLLGLFVSEFLAFMTLPPYPIILSAWHTPGWSMPFWYAVVTGSICFADLWVLPKVSRYVPWLALIVFAFSALPAATTLDRLLPALQNLHDAPVTRGWGFWMMELGMLGYAAGFWLAEVIFARLDEDETSSTDKVPDIMLSAFEVKTRYESRLMSIPNVVAVGIGMRDGHPDPVIIVSVTQHLAMEGVSDELPIPQILDGVRVYVEVISEPQSQQID